MWASECLCCIFIACNFTMTFFFLARANGFLFVVDIRLDKTRRSGVERAEVWGTGQFEPAK